MSIVAALTMGFYGRRFTVCMYRFYYSFIKNENSVTKSLYKKQFRIHFQERTL